MAAPRKRILRKDFRQPDRFMVFVGRCLELFRAYRERLIAAAAGVVVLAAAAAGWQYYRGYQRSRALEQYNLALAHYQAGSYEAALNSFQDLREQGQSPYDALAGLYMANSHIALNQPARAVDVLDAATREGRYGFLAQTMLVTLGLAQEMAGVCTDAVQSLDLALAHPGPLRQEAMLGKARCSARIGKPREALDGYRAYLEEFPESETVEIALRLQELEAASGKPAHAAEITR